MLNIKIKHKYTYANCLSLSCITLKEFDLCDITLLRLFACRKYRVMLFFYLEKFRDLFELVYILGSE